jgi:hypothetical protein
MILLIRFNLGGRRSLASGRIQRCAGVRVDRRFDVCVCHRSGQRHRGNESRTTVSRLVPVGQFLADPERDRFVEVVGSQRDPDHLLVGVAHRDCLGGP